MNQRQATNVITKAAVLPAPEVRTIVERIVAVQENLHLVLASLTKLATGTDEEVRRIASALQGVGRAQQNLCRLHQQTDDKLNALIAVVDGLVRARREQK